LIYCKNFVNATVYPHPAQQLKKKILRAPMAHACSPSYSGGRDRDYNLKPAWVNSSAKPYLEKPFTKIELVEWLKVKAPVPQ
jgi:hypothetical protein